MHIQLKLHTAYRECHHSCSCLFRYVNVTFGLLPQFVVLCTMTVKESILSYYPMLKGKYLGYHNLSLSLNMLGHLTLTSFINKAFLLLTGWRFPPTTLETFMHENSRDQQQSCHGHSQ